MYQNLINAPIICRDFFDDIKVWVGHICLYLFERGILVEISHLLEIDSDKYPYGSIGNAYMVVTEHPTYEICEIVLDKLSNDLKKIKINNYENDVYCSFDTII